MHHGSPNLEAFFGKQLTNDLIHEAGNLSLLSQRSSSALLQLGITNANSSELVARYKQLRAGLLSGTPTFVDVFGEGEVPSYHLKGARKCLAIIARKCSLLARVDHVRGSTNGSLGRDERSKLYDACQRLFKEGKVSTTDTQAIPIPEVYKHATEAEKRKQRGGLKLHKRLESMKEVGVLERATSRVKMGISEEQQRQELLERTDIFSKIQQQQEKQSERLSRKHPRPITNSEYDDLLNIAL